MKLPKVLNRKEINATLRNLEKEEQGYAEYRAEEDAQEAIKESIERECRNRADAEDQRHLKKGYKQFDKNYYNAHCDDKNYRW